MTEREIAMARYMEEINRLDNNIDIWSKEEIMEFRKNGAKEISEYGWHYTALDYNSYIIVLKYLLKRS
jgi:hypothetical protein